MRVERNPVRKGNEILKLLEEHASRHSYSKAELQEIEDTATSRHFAPRSYDRNVLFIQNPGLEHYNQPILGVMNEAHSREAFFSRLRGDTFPYNLHISGLYIPEQPKRSDPNFDLQLMVAYTFAKHIRSQLGDRKLGFVSARPDIVPKLAATVFSQHNFPGVQPVGMVR